MKVQPHHESLLEQICNVGSGVLLAWVMGFVVYPMFGVQFHPFEILGITLIFTAISVVRGFLWRRLFNKISERRLERWLHPRRHRQ